MVHPSVQISADSRIKFAYLSDASGKLSLSLRYRSSKDTHRFSSTEIKWTCQFTLTQEKVSGNFNDNEGPFILNFCIVFGQLYVP